MSGPFRHSAASRRIPPGGLRKPREEVAAAIPPLLTSYRAGGIEPPARIGVIPLSRQAAAFRRADFGEMADCYERTRAALPGPQPSPHPSRVAQRLGRPRLAGRYRDRKRNRSGPFFSQTCAGAQPAFFETFSAAKVHLTNKGAFE